MRTVLEKAGSPEAASERAIQLGWKYMSQGDWKTATKRFNQAWLLTPENGDVHWGFASALGLKGDYNESIRFFEKAVDLKPESAPILCDYGYTYIRMGTEPSQSKEAQDTAMDKAITVLTRAVEADPSYELTYFNLALARFYKLDYPGAWNMVFKAESLGGRSLDPAFIKDLTSRMARSEVQPH